MKVIKIELKGLNLDTLIGKLSCNVGSIKDIKRVEYDRLEFCANKNDWGIIKKLIKNFEYTVQDKTQIITKKIVASFLAVVIAMPIVLFFAIISSNYLWKIKIEGTGQVDKQNILTILADKGVKVGKKISINAKDIESILLENQQIAQCSCVYIGTTLIINISEKLVYTPTNYEPIRAKYSGFVEELDVGRGEVNCRIGDFVHQGDILVLPYIVDREGNNIPVEPKATISGKAYISNTVALPREEKVLVKSNKTKKYIRVCFGDKQKNDFSYYKPFVFYELKVYNTNISSILPFVRQKLVFYELVESTKINDLVSLQTENEAKSKQQAYQNLPQNMQVLEEKTMSVVANDVLFSTTTISFQGSLI